jgi:hypothetical protein
VIEVRRNFEMFCEGGVDDLANELLHRAGMANLGFFEFTVDDSSSRKHGTTTSMRKDVSFTSLLPFLALFILQIQKYLGTIPLRESCQ